MPHGVYRVVNSRIHDLTGNVADFFCAAVKQRLELPCDLRPIFTRRDLLRWHSSNADFLVRADSPAEHAFYRSFNVVRQLPCLVNRDVLHR